MTNNIDPIIAAKAILEHPEGYSSDAIIIAKTLIKVITSYQNARCLDDMYYDMITLVNNI